MMAFTRQTDALASVSPTEFKAAMRSFASTVSVVTSNCDGVLNGMTATAVCSVSADPPSLLIVVNQTNRSHALIQRSAAYTVNVLSAEQQHLAIHFASSQPDPFSAVPYSLGVNQCPVIDGTTASLECVVESEMLSGTHAILIGRVIACRGSERLPLLYFNGGFRA